MTMLSKNPRLLALLMILLLGCQGRENLSIDKITLGGEDLHGDLFQKRYGGKGDYSPQYNSWAGYEVSSNQEVEALLKENPNIEALRFSLWDHDTTKNLSLTEKIGDFKKLKFLEIHSNRIVSYPKTIEKLTGLEELVLQVGGRKEIEFSFSNFHDLRHLTIHFAEDLEKFPTSIFELKNLESLKLYRFPSTIDHQELVGIENLHKLQELYLWDSHLKLPDVEYAFPELRTLILDRYKWEIPSSIWKQSAIQRLVINDVFNPIDLDNVSRLKNLEVLYLSYHTKFDGALLLPNLEHLYIYHFQGASFSLSNHQLPKLESFVFWDSNTVKKLTINNANHLRSIKLVANEKLERLDCKGAFKELEEYILRANTSLREYPQSINGVQNTDVLD